MMLRSFARASTLAVTLAVSTAAVAQANDAGVETLPYSARGASTLGDSININAPGATLGPCIAFAAQNITWDTEGALQTKATLKILSASDKEKRDVDLSLGYQTTAKIKAGVFSGESEFEWTGTSSTMRESESTSLSLAFTAASDYGRRLLTQFSLTPEMENLRKVDPEAFVARCGTHFLRGERRYSDVSLVIQISGMSRQGKDALETKLKTMIGGGVVYEGLDTSAKSTLTASYKKIVEWSQRSATVEARLTAEGGPGIDAASALARATSPTDLAALGDIVSTVAKGFTQGNSTIRNYILLPNTNLGGQPVSYDVDRIVKIGRLTRQLISVNDALAQIKEYQKNIPDIFEKYFVDQDRRLRVTKAELVQRINQCAANGACSVTDSELTRDFVPLETLFSNASLKTVCTYQKADHFLTVPNGVVSPDVLEAISIEIRGDIPHYDAVDFTSLKIFKMAKDFVVEDVTPGFSKLSFSQPRGTTREAFGTLYTHNLKPKDLIRYDTTNRAVVIDAIELTERRDQVLSAMFNMEAKGPSSRPITFSAGFPDRQGCPLIRQ